MLWHGVHDLVSKAKAGDEQAWERLYALAQPHLRGCAVRRLRQGGPDGSLSDLVQESWVRAWEQLPRFAGGADDAQTGAMFRAWLGRIVRTVAGNTYRSSRTARRRPPAPVVSLDASRADGPGGGSPPTEPAADGSTPSASLRRDEDRARVRAALGRLEARDRQVIELCVFEGWSFREVGKRLGLDESTVRHHFQRILQSLGQRLQASQ